MSEEEFCKVLETHREKLVNLNIHIKYQKFDLVIARRILSEYYIHPIEDVKNYIIACKVNNIHTLENWLKENEVDIQDKWELYKYFNTHQPPEELEGFAVIDIHVSKAIYK